jgi:hypothetical protein
VLTVIGLFLLISGRGLAADSWPKEITFDEGSLTVYQPQADSYSGNVLEGRSAVSWTDAQGGAPIFGAVWLTMNVEIDRDERMVHVRELKVPQVRFPEAEEDTQQQLADYLERELPSWDLPLELDRLITDLDLLGDAQTPGLRHEPPKIRYISEPAVLVLIDGEPKIESVTSPGGDKFDQVVNTPFLIVSPEGARSYYLSGGNELWYEADKPEGPWNPSKSVPSKVAGLVEPEEGAETDTGDGPPPKILVATEPTELIISDGLPNWAPVEGVLELLYMTNTDSSVFLEISSQAYYTMLSGRWYRGQQVNEEWIVEHVPNDQLPEAFTDIPEESAVGEVLTQVAGTTQAREAVLDNAIPQTAAVNRDDNSFSVEYDGKPEFKPIEDASNNLQSAVNTEKSVFKLGERYYSCEQGIWYEADSPTGPWRVATEVPEAIYSIPASSPHHNVTYVHVYDVTPTVVYVGYTPGYMGSYYSHGCVVYGTGWHYSPWYGPHYYPRPWTWGLHVRYNPWYGWSFGVSFSNGPFRVTFGFGGWGRPPYHGWWGPGGYRPYPRPYVRPGYTRVNINRNININNININTGNQIGNRPRPSQKPNIYNRPANQDRLAERPSTRDRKQPGVAQNRPNDVFTDKSGNVYRKDQDGKWQQRDRGEWKSAEGLDRRPSQGRGSPPSERPSTRPAQPTTRPSQPSAQPSTRPSQPSIGRPPTSATRPGLERDSRSRQQGSSRSQSYSRSRSAPRGGTRRR